MATNNLDYTKYGVKVNWFSRNDATERIGVKTYSWLNMPSNAQDQANLLYNFVSYLPASFHANNPSSGGDLESGVIVFLRENNVRHSV